MAKSKKPIEGDGWRVDFDSQGNAHIWVTCEECGEETGYCGNAVCCKMCRGTLAKVPKAILDKYEGG